jgi:hypothetical protein
LKMMPSSRRSSPSRKQMDIESGLSLDFGSAAEEAGILARLWALVPTPSEAVVMLVEFFDTYAPLLAILFIPTSVAVKYVAGVLEPYFQDPNAIAMPPPPPAQPTWMQNAQDDFYELAKNEPGLYLALDLGIAFALGVLAFYWKDISDWLEARRLAGSYQKLDGDDEEEAAPPMNAQALRMELYKTINVIEEVRRQSKQNPVHTLPRGAIGAASPICARPCVMLAARDQIARVQAFY